MKGFFAFVLVIGALLVIAPATDAQELPIGDARNEGFRQHFQEIVKNNPTVTDFTKMPVGTAYKLSDGTTDELGANDQNGIWGREFQKWYGVSYSEFLQGNAPAPPTTIASTSTTTNTGVVQEAEAGYLDKFLTGAKAAGILIVLTLLLILGVLAIWALARKIEDSINQHKNKREMRRDPITSGTPYVVGGIPANHTERLSNFFDEQAVNRFATRNPHLDRSTIRPTRISEIEVGTIVGEGLVGYLGTEPRPRRIEQPLDAYRATYRFQDGTEEPLITLQGCMNPVTYGGDVYRGFTFTRREAVVPMPEPPRPTPEAVPHPAIAVQRIRAAASETGASTILVGGEMVTINHGAHFDLDSVPGSVKISGNAFEMTVKRSKVKTASNETSRTRATATGTGSN